MALERVKRYLKPLIKVLKMQKRIYIVFLWSKERFLTSKMGNLLGQKFF